jgi:general stress protein 26
MEAAMDEAVKNESLNFARNAGNVFFITSEDNMPIPRVVSIQRIDDDFTLWIATNGTTEKVRQIAANPNVALAVQKDMEVFTVIGAAEIIHDEVVKARLWKDSFIKLYPKGMNDPAFTIIKVRPRKVRYVNVAKYGFIPKQII